MSSSVTKTANGHYINGRAQVLEILQHLDGDHRSRLLNQIQKKNPALARELIADCFLFSDLKGLSNTNLEFLIRQIEAPILGLALKGEDEEFQKRFLKLAPRNYAEEAFQFLLHEIPNNDEKCIKAKGRVLAIAKSFFQTI